MVGERRRGFSAFKASREVVAPAGEPGTAQQPEPAPATPREHGAVASRAPTGRAASFTPNEAKQLLEELRALCTRSAFQQRLAGIRAQGWGAFRTREAVARLLAETWKQPLKASGFSIDRHGFPQFLAAVRAHSMEAGIRTLSEEVERQLLFPPGSLFGVHAGEMKGAKPGAVPAPAAPSSTPPVKRRLPPKATRAHRMSLGEAKDLLRALRNVSASEAAQKQMAKLHKRGQDGAPLPVGVICSLFKDVLAMFEFPPSPAGFEDMAWGVARFRGSNEHVREAAREVEHLLGIQEGDLFGNPVDENPEAWREEATTARGAPVMFPAAGPPAAGPGTMEVVVRHAVDNEELVLFLNESATFMDLKFALARKLGSEDILTKGRLVKKRAGVYLSYKDADLIGDVRLVLVLGVDLAASAKAPSPPLGQAQRPSAMQRGLEPAAQPAAQGGGSSRVGPAELSKEQALDLLHELFSKFSEPGFQQKLQQLEKQLSWGTPAFTKERRALLLTVHSKVLPRYGFEGTGKGTFLFSTVIAQLSSHQEVEALSAKVNMVCGMTKPLVPPAPATPAPVAPAPVAQAPPQGKVEDAGKKPELKGQEQRKLDEETTAATPLQAPLAKGEKVAAVAREREPKAKPAAAAAPVIIAEQAVPGAPDQPLRLCIAGTWSNWKIEDMRWTGSCFEHNIIVGENEWESFQLLVSGSYDTVVYPSAVDASLSEEWDICGPDDRGHGTNWQIGKGGLELGQDGKQVTVVPGQRFLIVVAVDPLGRVSDVRWRPQVADELRPSKEERKRAEEAARQKGKLWEEEQQPSNPAAVGKPAEQPAAAAVAPSVGVGKAQLKEGVSAAAAQDPAPEATPKEDVSSVGVESPAQQATPKGDVSSAGMESLAKQEGVGGPPPGTPEQSTPREAASAAGVEAAVRQGSCLQATPKEDASAAAAQAPAQEALERICAVLSSRQQQLTEQVQKPAEVEPPPRAQEAARLARAGACFAAACRDALGDAGGADPSEVLDTLQRALAACAPAGIAAGGAHETNGSTDGSVAVLAGRVEESLRLPAGTLSKIGAARGGSAARRRCPVRAGSGNDEGTGALLAKAARRQQNSDVPSGGEAAATAQPPSPTPGPDGQGSGPMSASGQELLARLRDACGRAAFQRDVEQLHAKGYGPVELNARVGALLSSASREVLAGLDGAAGRTAGFGRLREVARAEARSDPVVLTLVESIERSVRAAAGTCFGIDWDAGSAEADCQQVAGG